jgi:glycosyltransferase involved in cell wall biosynthesis
VPDPAPDIVLVSVTSTTGWGSAARQLAASLTAAGARVGIAETGRVPEVRTFMGTDLVQAFAARRTAAAALAAHRPRALVYCSMTAALLWPAPGAIWLDSLAAENRPGRHGIWQRHVERRRLEQAPLVLTMAAGSLAPVDPAERPDAVVVPVAIGRSDEANPDALPPRRDIDVLAYTGDPVKRRLDFILESFARARRDGEQLVVTGTDAPRTGAPDGVRFTGRLPAVEFRGLLRRARVFVTAPRREDFGITALEALADGAMLVTTPAPGPYPALALARELDPRLVSDDLATALRVALDTPRPGYPDRAAALVEQFSIASVSATLGEHVLPRLLPGWEA